MCPKKHTSKPNALQNLVKRDPKPQVKKNLNSTLAVLEKIRSTHFDNFQSVAYGSQTADRLENGMAVDRMQNGIAAVVLKEKTLSLLV